MKRILFILIVVPLIFSCTKDKAVANPTPYHLKIPSHFPSMQIPEDNPMTVEGVKLGRELFYELRLSADNTMSCGTCHAPDKAFADGNQFSEGIDGLLGNRNSMALINLGWNESFFWDGRSKTLEEQIIQPVINPIEMHDTWMNVISKLTADYEYFHWINECRIINPELQSLKM